MCPALPYLDFGFGFGVGGGGLDAFRLRRRTGGGGGGVGLEAGLGFSFDMRLLINRYCRDDCTAIVTLLDRGEQAPGEH